MNFSVRKINIEDRILAELVATLHDEVFEDNEWLGRKVPTRGDWWLAFHGKDPAGFAGMVASVKTPNAGYLCRAGVLPKYRGHGLQKQLIRRRLAHAKKVGWSLVVSDTIQNPASSNSLIDCGFRLFHPEQPWGNEGALYWRCRIGGKHGTV